MLSVRRAVQSVLFRNIMALYAVQVCRKLIPLATIPYLTRVLGPSTWGTMAFVLTSVTCLVLFVEFGFGISATREIASNRDLKEECARVVAGVFGLQIILFALGLAILSFASFHLPILRDNPALFLAGIFYAV